MWFLTFMQSPAGRVLRVVVGASLFLYGMFLASLAGLMLMLVGMFVAMSGIVGGCPMATMIRRACAVHAHAGHGHGRRPS